MTRLREDFEIMLPSDLIPSSVLGVVDLVVAFFLFFILLCISASKIAAPISCLVLLPADFSMCRLRWSRKLSHLPKVLGVSQNSQRHVSGLSECAL